MIYDVCFIADWFWFEKNDNLQEVLECIKSSNKSWPLIDGYYYYEVSDSLKMPLYYVFKTAILHARDEADEAVKKYWYNKALRTYDKKVFVQFRQRFQREYQEALPYYQKWYKPPLDLLYGKEKAAEVRSKISAAMKNIDSGVIAKRNAAISEGMKRWHSSKHF